MCIRDSLAIEVRVALASGVRRVEPLLPLFQIEAVIALVGVGRAVVELDDIGAYAIQKLSLIHIYSLFAERVKGRLHQQAARTPGPVPG